MQNNRIRAYLQPPTSSDEAEVKLLGALQRETRRRQAAEEENKRLRHLVARCPRYREVATT